MKILMVNKFLYPKGGAETYVLKLGQILQEKGHEVQYFGLENPKNTVGNAVGAYVSDLDFSQGIQKNLTAPLRIVYCKEARRKIRKVLEHFQPDVVHLNNIQFHLTPSIILETHKYRTQSKNKVKIIYTAHDYQLVCPSHGLFDSNIQVCERCLGGNYTHCFRTKCIKNSRLKSFLGMVDGYVWKWSKAYTYIDKIICISHFQKTKLDTKDSLKNKTVMLHHCTTDFPEKVVEKENYILEFGHLCRDKGTYTLLRVAEAMPEIMFVFAGRGEAQAAIEEIPNAKYVGFQSGKDLEMLIRKAKITICPSEMHEAFGLTIAESISLGTPVIGSRMGGIPELIQEGETGELFEAGNAKELEDKIRKLLFTPGLLEQYSKNCSGDGFETTDSYYQKLMDIYGE